MMGIKFFLTALFSILLFWGCGSQKSIDLTPKTEVPPWYANPPQTTSATLYAIGEGQNREEAIANGLSMMASTLSVSIASQFNSKELVKEGLINSYQSTVSNEIQSDVKKLRISHYELLKSQEFGFRKYAVLLKSDKQKLYESLKNELDQKLTLIDKQKESLHQYDVIKQLGIYKKSKSDIADVPYTLIVMNVLNGSFESKDYLDKIEAINSDYERLLSGITFSISSDAESKNLQAPISRGLSAEKLQIKNSSGSKHLNITIKSKIEKASSYGFTLARSAIEIAVKDNKGSVIGSNKLNITGQSTQGYEIAKESVAVKLNEKIKKEGIGKVIGLDL